MSLRILWLLFLCGLQTAHACDICGNNPNSMYVGLLPNYTNHFIGLKHRFVKFETEHNDKQEYGKDVLHEMTLWGRYNLNKKVQIYASIPYPPRDAPSSREITMIALMVGFIIFYKLEWE